MSTKQWARLQFERVNQLVEAQSVPTSGWQVRNGQYLPDGYVWDEPHHPIAANEFWGRPDGTAEFIGSVVIPAELAGKKVWFQFYVGGEVIVYANGKIMDGIDPNRTRILLSEQAQAGERFDIRMEAYTRSKPDDDRAIPARDIRGCVQTFNTPHLVVLDEEALALKYDLDILYSMAFGERTSEDIQSRLHYHIEKLLRHFPLFDSELGALKTAVSTIKSTIDQHIFPENTPFGKTGKLACVAHSHLDIAYHWKAAQTVQKNARTTLIQLRLMDRFPDFNFTHSQAWCYETLEQYYPELFAELKQRIAEGRWEIVGGMYVEPDCNLPSAESLARQIMYGKRYFLEKFGVEVDNCWLPDVFGNTAVLPQLLKLGGIDYFVSNKMSTWNDTNQFPHNNFIWRGLDGSEVNACVPPTHFITWFEPDQVLESWDAFLDKDVVDESLHMYGYGDGGSGVTEEMLEHMARLEKAPGMPELRLSGGKEYLHDAFADTDQLSVWDGELYLEMHRGTFTTKGVIKRENRRGEYLAQETETLCTLAALQGANYPIQSLRKAWKKLLLNQFHDIIPGSHTNAVYHEAMETYATMCSEFETLRQTALAVLLPASNENSVTVFNPFSDARGGVALVQGGAVDGVLVDENGQEFATQVQQVAGGGERGVTAVPAIPPLGTKTLKKKESQYKETKAQRHKGRFENDFFGLRFDDDWQLVSIWDKVRGREVVAEGAVANEWQLFEDKPGKYNAWDILRNYKDHPIELPRWTGGEVVEDGPLSIAIRLQLTFGNSRTEQIIRLHRDIPRIDFETWIDWQETERLLKVAFPVSVKSRFYTTDTTAGGFERENHQNTPWQEARFEVCTHKWTDLSEGMFGVTLMNDSKYGVDVQGNVIRLSLLKAPIRPDRVSDKEEHRFTYSLFAHDGDWRRGGVVEAANDLNWPLVAHVGRTADPTGFGNLSGLPRALKCHAFKLAEDGSGDLVLRLVEQYGSRGVASITLPQSFAEGMICDLLERPLTPIKIKENIVQLPFQPYQIQTLRLSNIVI